jgi:hypothetical protein
LYRYGLFSAAGKPGSPNFVPEKLKRRTKKWKTIKLTGDSVPVFYKKPTPTMPPVGGWALFTLRPLYPESKTKKIERRKS